MVIAVLSGFAASLAAPLLHRFTRGLAGWTIALLPLGLFLYFFSFIGPVSAGETIAISYPWAPSLGVNLSFYLDGLSLLFALLILGIGTLVVIYSGGYLAGHEHLGRFYTYILMFMASMLGLVLSDNVITLFVFWELTSISSYLLIGFEHEEEASRSAALQALLVTGGGGLALLAGLVLLGQVGGTMELSLLFERGEAIRAHTLYLPVLLLVLAGAFTKSAQVPFHFWLPSAMEAPTPVSAYLHSATMVKAGVYLVARVSPILGGTDVWFYLVSGAGIATMLVGAYLALYHTNLKRILAYSTISSLGTLMLLLGLGVSGAIKAAIVFLLAHALYKGALFMVAGILYHETGTQEVEELGGLYRLMPITTIVGGLAALSLSGLGPVLSFIGKELFFEAVLESPRFAFLLAPAAVVSGAVSVAVAFIVGLRPFFGKVKPTPKQPHEAPVSLWLGPGVLALLGLVIGLAPVLVSATLVSPAVTAVLGEPAPVILALWHGLNPALALSGVSLLLGYGFYRAWAGLRATTSRAERYLTWGPHWWYNASLDFLNRFARFQTAVLQSGHLEVYLLIVITTTVGLVGYTLISRGIVYVLGPLPELRFYELGLAVLILLAALTAIRSRSRLAAVAALGVVGFGVALTFILFGAPDLAMTQLMIETMTVILFVLVFYHLPGFARLSSRIQYSRDMVVALSAGMLMSLLVLVTISAQHNPPISTFYVENAVPLAHGRNIVNVILVDFRALDTLGEITVLSLAGIGVFALLKLRLGKGRQTEK